MNDLYTLAREIHKHVPIYVYIISLVAPHPKTQCPSQVKRSSIACIALAGAQEEEKDEE